jgi:hypothetical protein
MRPSPPGRWPASLGGSPVAAAAPWCDRVSSVNLPKAAEQRQFRIGAGGTHKPLCVFTAGRLKTGPSLSCTRRPMPEVRRLGCRVSLPCATDMAFAAHRFGHASKSRVRFRSCSCL